MVPFFKRSGLATALDANEPSGRPSLPSPRLFTFNRSELPEDIQPGDSVTVYVSGMVKSMDDEGNVMVNITLVKDDDEPDEIRVTTQESSAV